MAENQAPNAAADVEMSQYVADRTRVNEDKIKQDDEIIQQFGDYTYGWHDTDFAGEAAKKGIDENVVRAISADKNEPEWMLEKRLEGYRDFINRPMPQWGVDLKDFDADDFKYYVKPIDKQATTWEELPDEIRATYDKLGIPEAEKSRLVSGIAAQYESEVIYNSIQKDLEDQGVIFVDTDTAVQKYPACILAEPYAKASTMSLGFAGKGQYQDTGAKMIHLAPHTSSTIVAKSISRGGGRSAYRGLVKIVKGAEGSSNSTVCDALLVDEFSRSDTYPHVDVREDDVSMAHEATVSKVSEDQLFYLMSRGLSEEEAMGMIVRGFVEPISRELPMEYALELNRLVELQMEGSVG